MIARDSIGGDRSAIDRGGLSSGEERRMNKAKARLQFAALPYRRRAGAILEVMLITSRDSGRWVIPKGWQGTGLAG
jgi:8-oxo-dGTP pyrophosphatase MutT (NUDIX family)